MKSPLMYDSTQPSSIPASPADAVVAGYLNHGDPLRPWKKRDWDQFPGRRKLPIFVRSNPTISLAEDDAFEALRDLYDLGAFKCLIALDIETANDVAYVTTYGNIMNRYQYLVLPYGSQDNLFKLPALQGRWVAAPGKKLSDFHRAEGVRIVQNKDFGSFDQSDMHDGISEFGQWWE